MEVVIVPDAKAGGELIAGAMAQLLRRKPDALLGVATGSTPLPVYQALAAQVRFRCRGRVPGTHQPSSTSTWGCRPSIRSRTVRCCGARCWSRSGCRHGRLHGARRHRRGRAGRVRGVRQGAGRGRRGRPPAAGDRHRRAHRLQRALLLARLADPDQDADRADPGRQRAVLRRRHRRRCRTTSSPRASARSWRPGTWCCSPRARARRTRWRRPWRGRSPRCVPASALQLHPHATVVVDEAAASKLKLADYFRHTFANKPEWQGI